MQWLQDANQSNVDNLNNVRRAVSGQFRNIKKEYLKAKIADLETTCRIQNTRNFYRGISDLKKGYHPRTDIVRDEKVYLVTAFHSILARWRKHISQLLRVLGVSHVR
jgi:tRNA A37 threonylcarbamoyladenosine dehydratase